MAVYSVELFHDADPQSEVLLGAATLQSSRLFQHLGADALVQR
jgi:hypothetical protein